MLPKYPIYIISKNRYQNLGKGCGNWDCLHTADTLDKMKVPYYVVVEPQDLKHYTDYLGEEKVLSIGVNDPGSSIFARNWVWEHSKAAGFDKHWILDDNIQFFGRNTHNNKIKTSSGSIFRAIEDFADRYKNVAIAGMNYDYFVPASAATAGFLIPPYYLNSRVYSCILIKNDIDETILDGVKWRGHYNEDTDLSIRVLKAGACTMLFNAFYCGKTPTMQMKGGNTDNLYAGTKGNNEGRLKMARSLREQHPDIVRVVKKFNKWHHQVDYSKFRNNILIRKDDWDYKNTNDEFGMVLHAFKDKKVAKTFNRNNLIPLGEK